MYENFFLLAIAFFFGYLYLNEKEEYLTKDLWFIIGAIFLFSSLFFNYSLSGVTSYPSYNATLNTTQTNIVYHYAILTDLSPWALGVGIVLLIIIGFYCIRIIGKYSKAMRG